MATTLFIASPQGNAFITLCSNEIACPDCGTKRDVSASFEAEKRPKYDLWKCKCKGCGLLLGYTYDMRGDAVCWDKKKAAAEEKERVKNEGPPPTQAEIDAFMAELEAQGPCDPEAEARALLAELEVKHKARKQSNA